MQILIKRKVISILEAYQLGRMEELCQIRGLHHPKKVVGSAISFIVLTLKQVSSKRGTKDFAAANALKSIIN